MGLSFDELNQLTLQDFLDFTDIWVDLAGGGEEDATRPATQADIDKFF